MRNKMLRLNTCDKFMSCLKSNQSIFLDIGRVYAYTYMYITYIYTYMYITYIYTYMYITYIYTYMYITYVYTYIHMYGSVLIHTNMYIHVYIDTYIHSYAHRRMDAHKNTYFQFNNRGDLVLSS